MVTHLHLRRPLSLPLLFLTAACASAHKDPAPPPPPLTVAKPSTPPAASSTAPIPMPPAELHLFAEGYDLRFGRTRGIGTLFDTRPGNIAEFVGDEPRIHRKALAPVLDDPTAVVRDVFGSAEDQWADVVVHGNDPNYLKAHFLARRHNGVFGIERKVDGESPSITFFAADRPAPYAFHGSVSDEPGGVVTRADEGLPGSPVAPTDPPSLAVNNELRTLWMGSRHTGHLTILGHAAQSQHRFGVQRWYGDNRYTRVSWLPDLQTPFTRVDVALCLSPKGEAIVVRDLTTKEPTENQDDLEGNAQLAIWDGTSWKEVPIPSSSAYYEVKNCDPDKDGSIWIAWQSNLRVHPGDVRIDRFFGDQWSRVTVPALQPRETRHRVVFDREHGRYELVTEPVPVEQRVPGYVHIDGLTADETGTIWVHGVRVEGNREVTLELPGQRTIERRVVFRSGPPRPGGPLSWDQLTEGNGVAFAVETGNRMLKQAAAAKALPAATPGCGTIFVVVNPKVASTTPPDTGYPDLVATIKQVPATLRLVEAWMGGRTVLGVIAQEYQGALAMEVALGRRGPKQSQLLCGVPPIVREIAIP